MSIWICIHKGLLPEDYTQSFPGRWQYAKVDDVGRAPVAPVGSAPRTVPRTNGRAPAGSAMWTLASARIAYLCRNDTGVSLVQA